MLGNVVVCRMRVGQVVSACGMACGRIALVPIRLRRLQHYEDGGRASDIQHTHSSLALLGRTSFGLCTRFPQVLLEKHGSRKVRQAPSTHQFYSAVLFSSSIQQLCRLANHHKPSVRPGQSSPRSLPHNLLTDNFSI